MAKTMMKILVPILLVSFFASETYCQTCISCKKYLTSGGLEDECMSNEVCLDGICYNSLPPSHCKCPTTDCRADPIDPDNYLIDCSDQNNPEYIDCSNFAGTPDFGTCTCDGSTPTPDPTTPSTSCPPCGYKRDPDTNCDYIKCKDGNNIPDKCPHDRCYNSANCQCDTFENACPSCGKYPDPNTNNPCGYVDCDNGDTIKVCAQGTCFVFDDNTCACEPVTTTTPVPTTTTPTPSCPNANGCDRVPYGSCGYKYCDDAVTEYNCAGLSCFDPNTCYCEFNNS